MFKETIYVATEQRWAKYVSQSQETNEKPKDGPREPWVKEEKKKELRLYLVGRNYTIISYPKECRLLTK